MGGGELVESNEQEVEVRPKVPVATPTAMSASELAEHRDGGHLPYRSGCPDCVEAFGREDGHAGDDKLHGRAIPLVSLEYLFVTPKGVYTIKEFEDADPELFAVRDDHPDVMKAIVIYSSKDKCIGWRLSLGKGPTRT